MNVPVSLGSSSPAARQRQHGQTDAADFRAAHIQVVGEWNHYQMTKANPVSNM